MRLPIADTLIFEVHTRKVMQLDKHVTVNEVAEKLLEALQKHRSASVRQH